MIPVTVVGVTPLVYVILHGDEPVIVIEIFAFDPEHILLLPLMTAETELTVITADPVILPAAAVQTLASVTEVTV